MTTTPNKRTRVFNLPTLSAAQTQDIPVLEPAVNEPVNVSEPGPVADVKSRLQGLPEREDRAAAQIPPSPPLAAYDGSVSKGRGKSRNKKYNLSIDKDLIPRIRWAVQQETGFVYKQGYLYLKAVDEVSMDEIGYYLDAYRRNLSTVPQMPEVQVRLGTLHTVPTAPSFTPEQMAVVQERADRLGISRSRYFATALRIYLDRHQLRPPSQELLAENLQQYIASMGLEVPAEDIKRLVKKARVIDVSATKDS